MEDGSLFTCNCQNAYTGKTCENDPCTPFPCGDGICSVTETGYDCNCTGTVYFGDKCQITVSCENIDCGLHGDPLIIADLGGLEVYYWKTE